MDYTCKSLLRFKRSRSRLLNLPPELQDLIFGFAVTLEKPVVTFRLDEYQKNGYQEAIQPALTRVNRQTREQSLPLFYELNDFILHAETPKIVDTRRWLQCVRSYLPRLLKLSLWIRYVTLTNDRSASNGAIAVSLRRSKSDEQWKVDNEWKWITVTRPPQLLASDAKFLARGLDRMLTESPDCLDSVEGMLGVMTDLKLFYIKEKMS